MGGKSDACFVIAEAGSNHNRNFETAKKLILAAKEARADAVKFQTYSAETLYPKDKEPLRQIGERTRPFDVIKAVELPRQWQKTLAKYAKLKNIIFMSTPFDKEAIDEVSSLSPVIKWASPELIDRPLLEYAAKKGKPLFISTGFYGIKEVTDALYWVQKSGNNQVVLLQCTGLYPTEFEDVNLKAMITMKNKFNVPIGFSDHTMSTITPALAVAMGAKVVEKHFTLDRKMKGPDHQFALEPDELKEMVKNIRDAEKSLGNEMKKPVLREVEKEKLIRRGVVSKMYIKKGESFSIKNICTKRVGRGALPAYDFFNMIGKISKRDINKDRPVNLKDAIS